jgi:hypothetical protein
MKYKIISSATFLFAFSSVLTFSFCDQKKEKSNPIENNNKATINQVAAQNNKSIADTNGLACDSSLWKNVYNPERLEVINKCMTVTGVIEESNADDDGDQHMLLRLDAGQENLLRPRNMKKKDGCLVIEAVCINNATRKKVGDACDGYVNHVQLPEVGNHVKVSGSYVVDSHNDWAEIHPISKVEVIK